MGHIALFTRSVGRAWGIGGGDQFNVFHPKPVLTWMIVAGLSHWRKYRVSFDQIQEARSVYEVVWKTASSVL